MKDRILEEETHRLGYNPIKTEKDFLKYVHQIPGYRLEANNLKDKHVIDYKFKELEGDKIIAWVDFESRSNKLSEFPSIHIPIHSFASFDRQDFNSISPKVDFYKTHPESSFHLSWSVWEKLGYLILAKDILISPEEKTKNGQRNKVLYDYNVPKNKCLLVYIQNMISQMIQWLNQLEYIKDIKRNKQ